MVDIDICTYKYSQCKLFNISLLVLRYQFQLIVDINIFVFKHQRMTKIGWIKAPLNHYYNFNIQIQANTRY